MKQLIMLKMHHMQTPEAALNYVYAEEGGNE